jgi:hypothetical protein
MVQSYIASLAFATVLNITTDQAALLGLKTQISYDPHNILVDNGGPLAPLFVVGLVSIVVSAIIESQPLTFLTWDS